MQVLYDISNLLATFRMSYIYLRFVSLNIWESMNVEVKSSSLPKILLCMILCNNIVSFEDFSVLANETNDFRIKLQKSLLIHRNGPQLKKASESALLMLFS